MPLTRRMSLMLEWGGGRLGEGGGGEGVASETQWGTEARALYREDRGEQYRQNNLHAPCPEHTSPRSYAARAGHGVQRPSKMGERGGQGVARSARAGEREPWTDAALRSWVGPRGRQAGSRWAAQAAAEKTGESRPGPGPGPGGEACWAGSLALGRRNPRRGSGQKEAEAEAGAEPEAERPRSL